MEESVLTLVAFWRFGEKTRLISVNVASQVMVVSL